MDSGRRASLTISGLHVHFRTSEGVVHAVRGLDFEVAAGETVAVVGESGSGKSQVMMAAMGLLAENGWAEGSVRFQDEEILGLPARELNKYRGGRLSMIFQEPMTSLDPLYPVGKQIAEILVHHRRVKRRQALARALELLELVQIPEAPERLLSYPHELSGGQRQRVMIAMALANEPEVLIADEPTTALDVTIQAEILSLLKELQDRLGMAVVLITHDLNIVRRIAERVYVMREGEVVESGPREQIFTSPRHAYTRMLLEAEPRGRRQSAPRDGRDLLAAREVTVAFARRKSGFLAARRADFRAVDAVDLTLKEGRTLGIVGESGSGKSTLARALLRLVPCAGEIRFDGHDLLSLERGQMRRLRRQLQIVFQDPFGSLSPRMTAGEIVSEGLLVHEPDLTTKQRDARAAEAFTEVKLDPLWRNRYPHEFSGGQRQRIAIARAIILKPKLMVLDEPTSALDRSVQKQIVTLLQELQHSHGLSYIFISHDLAVVRALADHILVMKSGRIVEEGPGSRVFGSPREAYTKALLAAAFGSLSA